MIAALAAALGAGGGVAHCDQWSRETAWEGRTGRALDLGCAAVARELRMGTYLDLQRLDCAYDMDRMFNSPPSERSHRFALLAEKTLLILPLLQSGNLPDLAIRSRLDLASAIGRRKLLRDREKQPPVTVPDGAIALDLHVHTSASPDSLASPTDILLAAARRGLSGIAVTDHDTVEAVPRTIEAAANLISAGRLPAHFLVIPGEEVSSSDGHIVALFIKDRIPSGQTADWTVRAIHEQGGVAIAAHPTIPTGVGDLASALPFDAVETQSASAKLYYAITPNARSRAGADSYLAQSRAQVGSSDSHDPGSIAECYTLVTCSPTLEDARRAILAGHTTAAATASESQEKAIARRTITRVVSFYQLLTRLNPLIPGLANSDSISLSLLPCPAIRYCREF